MATTDPATRRRWARWVHAWTALSLPGLGLAVLAWGPATAGAIAATVAFPAAVILAMAAHVGWQERGQPPGEAGMVAGWIGRALLCVVTVVVSMAAVIALVPGAALLLVVLAGGTTPPATSLRRRVLGQAPAPAGTHPETAGFESTPEGSTRLAPPEPAEAAREMTDAELCRAWRDSYWTLRETRDPLVKAAVVRRRQCFLDEFEARNATALGAWLASGAHPSGGPDRFLTKEGGGEGTQPAAA